MASSLRVALPPSLSAEPIEGSAGGQRSYDINSRPQQTPYFDALFSSIGFAPIQFPISTTIPSGPWNFIW